MKRCGPVKYKLGEVVRVTRAYRGYYACTIVDIISGMYTVEFSSGMTEYFYEDELENQ